MQNIGLDLDMFVIDWPCEVFPMEFLHYYCGCIALVPLVPLSPGGFVNVNINDELWDYCVIVPVVKDECWKGLTANFVVLLLLCFPKDSSKFVSLKVSSWNHLSTSFSPQKRQRPKYKRERKKKKPFLILFPNLSFQRRNMSLSKRIPVRERMRLGSRKE